MNLLNAVTDAVRTTAYGYDNVGNLQSVAYPNTVAHSYSYDNRNRLTSLGVAGPGGQLAGYSYLLDASGHRLSVTELSGRMVSYGYDNLYRLTSESIAADPHAVNGTIGYSGVYPEPCRWDAVGNHKQLTSTLAPVPAGLWNYDANDRFTAGDTYHANGNTTSSGGITNAYDFENRLVQKGGVTIVYDGDGNRVSKTAAAGTTQYLVDTLNPTGYAQVLDEVQNGAVSRTYSWGLELIDQARLQPSAAPAIVNYYVFDGHGSVRALTNATGTITDSYDYDAFGNLIRSTGSTPNLYLYSGEQFDPDLNLYYNRARYLNVSTGRFWTMDDYEGNSQDPPSLHKYLYAGNDSVNQIDPSGRDFDLISTIGALAVQYSLVTTTVISAGLGGAGGCIAGAFDSRSNCKQGFYSGLLAGAVFGAIGGVGSPAVRVVLGVAFSGWGGVSAYAAAKRHDYGLAAFYTVASLGSAFLTARLAYSTWGPSATLPPPPSTPPLPPGYNSNWTQMYGTRGGFTWFDEADGEWRWHAADAYHPDAHWDYNPWADWNSPWQNIPAGGPAPPPPAPTSGTP